MPDRPAAHDVAAADDIVNAVRAITEWDHGTGSVTGIWIDRSVRTVGVGIARGDEIETTEELRRLVPSSVRVRARVATADGVRVRQLQVEVMEFLDANGIWGRWAVALGPDGAEQVVELGLLASTPPEVVSRIRRRFSGCALALHLAVPAIAL